MLSRNLERTLHHSIASAADRRHSYATLEHLLFGLIDDEDAAPVLHGCGVDIERLRLETEDFLNKDLGGLVDIAPEQAADPKPTAGFQRVVQRAAIHVQSSGHNDVTGADILEALFSERESYAVYFLQSQDMTRLDAVNFINHGTVKTRGQSAARPQLDAVPSIPEQGIGPHVEINSEGIISFPPAAALDRHGNHLPRLRALHPEIRELACQLVEGLTKGNAPHAILAERVAAYAALVDQDLPTIDFRRLYLSGVRLANVAHATERAISRDDLSPLPLSEQEKLDSLLALHGSFILATASGAEAMEAEERYKRRPREEKRYRADAIALAAALQNRPDLINADVAEQVLGAAQDVGKGTNSERSTVAGSAMVRNVALNLVGGAIGGAILTHGGLGMGGTGAGAVFLGKLAISEAIKKTSWFKSIVGSMSSTMDSRADSPAMGSQSTNASRDSESKKAAIEFRSALRRYAAFIMKNEPTVRELAGKRQDLEFLQQALDWLKINTEKSSHEERE